ncbi:FAD synthetase family protein [Pseudonocardia benzenivorans]|uniref:FAD synthase n=1 Tax=Pseudonocardia benzenivorans TaxID=228005 RepID=A0ABW3VBP6_9PSEU
MSRSALLDPVLAPVWRGLGEIPDGWGRCVVTLGVFDGVHRGHAHLIGSAVRLGRARRLPTVLVTFDPHPARVLGLPRDTAALSTVERRAELAHQLGVDAVCVVPFTPALARVEAGDFAAQVLVGALHADAVVVGSNFTFGHRGTGDVDALRRLGEEHGFSTHPVGLLHAVGTPCSSTYIRGCLARGDVVAAARALGCPHRVDGVLFLAGEVVGAEVVVAEGAAVPAPGRYVGRLTGTVGRPVDLEVTAAGRLFVRLPGRAADLAGQSVAVDFLRRGEDR